MKKKETRVTGFCCILIWDTLYAPGVADDAKRGR